MTYHILHGKTNILDEDCFATITTYGMALRNEYLQERVWDCLILDEAQAIKNPGTKQTRAIKKIPSKMRIAMTGTPIENDLSNLWSLFDFLNKGLLGSCFQARRSRLFRRSRSGHRSQGLPFFSKFRSAPAPDGRSGG